MLESGSASVIEFPPQPALLVHLDNITNEAQRHILYEEKMRRIILAVPEMYRAKSHTEYIRACMGKVVHLDTIDAKVCVDEVCKSYESLRQCIDELTDILTRAKATSMATRTGSDAS